MEKFIVDTNIMIRFIVNDDDEKFKQVLSVVDRVERNEMRLIVPTIVIAECCWLLKSYFKFDKSKISEFLLDILNIDNVDPEERLVKEALILFSDKNVDFADALLSVMSNSTNPLTPVLTFDQKDFKKLNCEYYKPKELI
ncbi:PIN domain-containing protein [Alkalihalobacillus oceani]|uniref:PIN domain-containing protein n=1 Tax=Halalkalibacter oceani TaxID=1653776 RepID=A0A9X2DPP0_9BACI|nr:PIN domain-containing protein [Halalkalibacter oceani]MCM3714107.1 PIN domain-containing protein [Halalkalibacter oceani]